MYINTHTCAYEPRGRGVSSRPSSWRTSSSGTLPLQGKGLVAAAGPIVSLACGHGYIHVRALPEHARIALPARGLFGVYVYKYTRASAIDVAAVGTRERASSMCQLVRGVEGINAANR